jgi:uncharacterized membrane protein SpoIIM required for sporulation
MRETRFIAQNKEKWNEFELLLNSQFIHPDDLQKMYVQVTDDLSFARTFYPNRSVRVYLNYLSQKIFTHLYKTKKSPVHQFVNFWRYDLPQLVWEARWEFGLAALVFGVAVAIGVISTMIDADFPRQILGDSYVDETLKNISKGDPAAIYKSGSAMGSTLGITANNIFVSLLVFVSGIIAGIGSIFLLLQNGIMLGSFQYFFISRGVGINASLAIWLHGTFEISAIVIAGAAGLTMGKGLLFPGTYRRLQAFQRSARRGFEIMTGTIPLFLVAGFVEGTFTRYTDAPAFIRASFILLCAAIVLGYFVYYPYYLSKKGFKNPLKDAVIPPDNLDPIVLRELRSTSDVFSDTFSILRKEIGTILSICLAFTFAFLAFFFYMSDKTIGETVKFDHYWTYSAANYQQFFNNKNIAFWWLINPLIFSLFATLMTLLVKKIANEPLQISFKKFVTSIAILYPIHLFIYGLMQIEILGLLFLVFIMLLGFIMMWNWESSNNSNPFEALGSAVSMTFERFAYLFGNVIFMLFVSFAIQLLLDTFLTGLIWDFLVTNLRLDSEEYLTINTLYHSSITIFSFFISYILLLISSGLVYYTILEIYHGETLLDKIQNIALKKRVRGMELE